MKRSSSGKWLRRRSMMSCELTAPHCTGRQNTQLLVLSKTVRICLESTKQLQNSLHVITLTKQHFKKGWWEQHEHANNVMVNDQLQVINILPKMMLTFHWLSSAPLHVLFNSIDTIFTSINTVWGKKGSAQVGFVAPDCETLIFIHVQSRLNWINKGTLKATYLVSQSTGYAPGRFTMLDVVHGLKGQLLWIQSCTWHSEKILLLCSAGCKDTFAIFYNVQTQWTCQKQPKKGRQLVHSRLERVLQSRIDSQTPLCQQDINGYLARKALKPSPMWLHCPRTRLVTLLLSS